MRKDKILGVLFLGTLLSSFILCFVFMALGADRLGFRIAGFCCFGIFAGTIVGAGIVLQISAHLRHKRLLKRIAEAPLVDAEVLACTGATKDDVAGYTCRPIKGSIIYHVRLDVDGAEKHAYTAGYYNKGEIVKVRVHPFKTSHAAIEETPAE